MFSLRRDGCQFIVGHNLPHRSIGECLMFDQ